jgi:DNA mismatch endonuclease (patch repair protein)
MADVFSPDQRSRIMARIRSTGNRSTELRFAILLRESGIRGWRRGSKLPGRPDFVFRKQRLAVFIDGDFWHGNPNGFRIPKSNRGYWEPKIEGNRRRDRVVNRMLRARGWMVVRFWQSSLRNPGRVTARLRRLLDAKRPARGRRAARAAPAG